MRSWKTRNFSLSGVRLALQRWLAAPAGRRLARTGHYALPRKLRAQLNAKGASVLRDAWHPGVLMAFRGGHVALNSIGLLAVVAVVVLSFSSEWRARAARHALHLTSDLGADLSAATPAAESVAYAPAALRDGERAEPAISWDALARVPSVAGLAAKIPNTQVLREARESATAGTPREQAAVAEYIARKYRVATAATGQLVQAAYQTGREVGLDPLLILGVMAIESSFNPFAESVMGAQGLMQVMTKLHRDKYEKIGGVGVALNPYANIKVGALVLKDCIARAGSIEGGLKRYVGAVTQTDGGYGGKVLRERARLRLVAVSGQPSAGMTPARPVASQPVSARPQEADGLVDPTARSESEGQV